MSGKCRSLGFVTLVLLAVVAPSAQFYQPTNFNDPRGLVQRRAALANLQQSQGRFLFPLEINVPDVINGFLSAFRFIWGRFQSIFGLSGSQEIVGAKDPPVATPTPSLALQAVPLAPEDDYDEDYGLPTVKTVSVEVDDPVRHPSMHKKTKIKNWKPPKKKRKKNNLAAEWELIAMEEGWYA